MDEIRLFNKIHSEFKKYCKDRGMCDNCKYSAATSKTIDCFKNFYIAFKSKK